MIQFQFSKRLQAILPIENYNLVLNEQSRQNKNKRSLNVIKFEQFEPLLQTRRKSCVCTQCGNQSQFQFKTMNIPFCQQKQKLKVQLLVINKPLIEIRKSVFFHKLSLPVHIKETRNMDLQFEIHGIKKNSQYRDSLKKMVSESQDRARINSSQHSSNSIDNSLGSPGSVMSLQQPLSPRSVLIPLVKSSIFQPHINKTFDTQHKINTNLYLKTSQHKGFIQPITRILNSQFQKSNSLPPIQNSQMIFRMKTIT